MNAVRRLAAGGILAALAGCAGDPAATPPLGTVQLRWEAGRSIQYRADQIGALKVTLAPQGSGVSHTRVFGPEGLRLASGGASFAFEALHLIPGAYTARLEAYVDAGATIGIGSVASPPFTVVSNETARVVLPALTLASTPLGQWEIQVAVSTSSGLKPERLSAELSAIDGAQASLPAEAAQASRTFTWDNVAAPAGGTSTVSVTVTASRGNRTYARTQVATASLLADRRVSSRLSFAFP
ncbi:MAG TPA: hypothetical protein V6D00_09510 [Pantanalinema sp.]